MADTPKNTIPRKPVAIRLQPGQLQPGWERQLAERFRQTLSTKRMNELSRTSSHRSSRRQRSPQRSSEAVPRYGTGRLQAFQDAHSAASLDTFDLGTAPSSYSLLDTIPLMPEAPSQALHHKFRSQLQMLSETPQRWENPGLLDDAMKVIPLEQIYKDAEKEARILEATGVSMGKTPAWAYPDCVIRALLKWFKKSFFKWVNNPTCSRCHHMTVACGYAAPTQEERALSGNRVELYQCSNENCGAYERFPRYNDAFVLLQTKRGRCGEWVNCFSMLCRAMGARVRWVWNSEDHVWTEIYSEHRKRWVHVDVCEGAFDRPTMYSEGWKRSMGYCIAFSRDGATDVTLRYCRNPRLYGLPRKKCPESVLLYIMDEIRTLRRRDMAKDEKFKLEGEDTREVRELRHYYVTTMVSEIADLLPSGRRLTPDEQKIADERARQPSSAQWNRERGEDRTERSR